MNKINEYKNKFPFGLEEFCRALSNPERVAIASLLYEKGPLNLKSIGEHLNITGGDNLAKIVSSLRHMLNLGVVKRTNSKFIDGILVSEFELNKIYKRFIENLVGLLEVKK